jgi:Xaa-Pro aminopeptidase
MITPQYNSRIALGGRDTLFEMMSSTERLGTLRRAMAKEGLSAYVVEEVDPHQSEYPPASWRRRSWVSGFTGSAGTVVVTDDAAALWTDSRYYLEAEEALEGTGIVLHRDGEVDTPTMEEWLVDRLPAGASVGLPEETTSIARLQSLRESLESHEIIVRGLPDILLPLWKERPEERPSDIWSVSPEVTGEESRHRLGRLRQWLADRRLDGIAIATLDDIAWLLNIRGWDVPYNPVVVAFLLVEPEDAILFVRTEDAGVQGAGVRVEQYDRFYDVIRQLPESYRLAGDPELLPHQVEKLFPGRFRRESQPTRQWKSVKTRQEVEGMAECAIRDGVALARFFQWLEDAMENGKMITEGDCRDALVEFKSRDPDYLGESFEAISAVGPHGAVIHYRVTAESNATLRNGELYLLDQGSHYRFGTTDATRVETLGKPDRLQREDYTEVLRAHIALATVRFPRGTRGEQLDTVARDVLWRRGRNYGHGTGHGVGFLLNVHEGPCRIAPKCSNVALLPGMVLSNEPGVYRPGLHGIRFENLLAVVEEEAESFLAFRTLGIAPVDPRLIDSTLLSPGEKAWIEEYQSTVVETLGPRLDATTRSWLERRSGRPRA